MESHQKCGLLRWQLLPSVTQRLVSGQHDWPGPAQSVGVLGVQGCGVGVQSSHILRGKKGVREQQQQEEEAEQEEEKQGKE